MPSGRLFRNRVTPLSGELREGAAWNGINRYRISGNCLYLSNNPIHYASSNVYQINTESERKILEEFIREIEIERIVVYDNATAECAALTRVFVAIKRLKMLAPDKFYPLEDGLTQAIDSLLSCFKEYKDSNPPLDNKQKISGEEYEKTVEKLRKALKEKVYVSKKLVKHVKQVVYPVIFGSTTVHTLMPSGRNNDEHCPRRALRMGKDIQLVFVNPVNRNEMESFLEQHDFTDRVRVYTIEELQQATKICHQASPYFTHFMKCKGSCKGSDVTY